MCMCLARGGMGGEGGEWMRGLGLCFACGGVAGVGVEWVGGFDHGLEGWGGVM